MMDPRMVFVKTVVYHVLGTSMPYPFRGSTLRTSAEQTR
jgi:hypothetical protein